MAHSVIETGLQDSAFWILGVTVRDDRQKIVAAADDKSLELDPAHCQKLRAELTSPRTRLAAEMGWLPGLSPSRAAELVRGLPLDLIKLCREQNLPRLARANLLVSSLQAHRGDASPDALSAAIAELGRLSQSLRPEIIGQEINEDRAIAGFPQVREADVQSELTERRRRFREVIRAVLENTPSRLLVDVFTKVVESETANGHSHAPELIDDLVDSYEVHAQSFLEAEARNVQKLVAAVREMAKRGDELLEPLIVQLEDVVRHWDWVAQPIQLSAKARGIDHQPSLQLAWAVRALSVELVNEHQMLDVAQRLNQLLGETFAEVPKSAEKFEEDAQALQDLAKDRAERAATRRAWEHEITYSAEIGMLPRSVLEISPQGVSWRNATMALGDISLVRWGGVRHSINGIPNGTTYTIGLGDGTREFVISLRNEEVYSKFIGALWKAVGVRLVTSLVEQLRQGHRLSFGGSIVSDDGLTLSHQGWFKSSEPQSFTWSEVKIWNQPGSFVIGSQIDKNRRVELSYLQVPNVHVLEHAIRVGLKHGARKLSDLLND